MAEFLEGCGISTLVLDANILMLDLYPFLLFYQVVQQ